MEVPGVFKSLLGGVAGVGVKATLLEDQTEGIGDQTIVVYDQNALRSRYHSGRSRLPLSISHTRLAPDTPKVIQVGKRCRMKFGSKRERRASK